MTIINKALLFSFLTNALFSLQLAEANWNVGDLTNFLPNFIRPARHQNVKYFPHEDSCQHYYVGFSEEDKSLKRCPDGHTFDFTSLLCTTSLEAKCWKAHYDWNWDWDWDYNRGHKPKFICPFPWGIYPDVENCAKYYLCDNNKPHHEKCPSGEKFDKNKKECISKKIAECANKKDEKHKKFKCPYSYGEYEFPEDCSKYYLCLRKKPSVELCKHKQLFDGKHKRCKDMHKVDCGSRPNPYNYKPTTTTFKPTEITSTTPQTKSSWESTPSRSTAAREVSKSTLFPTEISEFTTNFEREYSESSKASESTASEYPSSKFTFIPETNPSENTKDEFKSTPSETSYREFTSTSESSPISIIVSDATEISQSTDSQTTPSEQGTSYSSADTEITKVISEITSDIASSQFTESTEIESKSTGTDTYGKSTKIQDEISTQEGTTFSEPEITNSVKDTSSTTFFTSKTDASEATSMFPTEDESKAPETTSSPDISSASPSIEDETSLATGTSAEELSTKFETRLPDTTREFESTTMKRSSVEDFSTASQTSENTRVTSEPIFTKSSESEASTTSEEPFTSSQEYTSSEATSTTSTKEISELSTVKDTTPEVKETTNELSSKETRPSTLSPSEEPTESITWPKEFVCPTENGNFPHETSCKLYYSCKDFLPTLEVCPEGLLFDSRLLSCNNADEVDCDDKITILPSKEPKGFECPVKRGKYPHKLYCQSYYQCEDYVAILKECPDGLLFDGALLQCNNRDEVDCGNRIYDITSTISSSRPTAEITEEPTSSSEITKSSRLTPTPSEETSIITKGWTVASTSEDITHIPTEETSSSRTSPPVTPEITSQKPDVCYPDDETCVVDEDGEILKCNEPTGRFPHPKDKHRFLQCYNYAILIKKCASKLIFDPVYKICSLPR